MNMWTKEDVKIYEKALDEVSLIPKKIKLLEKKRDFLKRRLVYFTNKGFDVDKTRTSLSNTRQKINELIDLKRRYQEIIKMGL